MFAASPQTLKRRALRPLVWLLSLALVAYGHSSVMLQLLGPAHRHQLAAASDAPSWLHRVNAVFHDVRVWRAELHQRLLPFPQDHGQGVMNLGSHPHAHAPAASLGASTDLRARHALAHAGYERHHHDAQDTTVIALDGGLQAGSAGDAASAAGTGSATLPLALAPVWAPMPMPECARVWSQRALAAWADAALSPPEHPPRA